jgi:hypothetical protein
MPAEVLSHTSRRRIGARRIGVRVPSPCQLGGTLDPREVRPLFGTETALEPGRAALAGAATGGAGGVTEGELAVDIGPGLAGAIIRTISRVLGSSNGSLGSWGHNCSRG